jgi:hypothetical protein
MGLRRPPYAFTEQGVAMLSSVLRSEQAVQVNPGAPGLADHEELSRKLAALEKKYDKQFKVAFDAIRQLMTPPPATPKRKIGFRPGTDK